jgi:RHS repeat-associated protein
VNNYTPITINYAPNGNITQKSDVGAYVYDATKVNAVKEVNSNNLDVLAQQNITYSSFQSPTLIKEGDYQLELLYSHDRSRKKTTLKQNNQTKQSTYFSGGYEKQVDAQNNTTELHYLNNINTIVVKQNNQYKYYFTYKDHLGTIVAITDINGNVVEEFNYDAWGLKRNPDNWTYELDTTPSTLTWFKRGYTGHEHLDEFGLINMNSRLYDPQIGRMLSPDNYIQSAGYSQNYNRYSYVWNNPMKYTDPSGDLVFTALTVYTLFFTDFGYDIQKYVSPVAVKFNLGYGSSGFHAGVETSIGVPKSVAFSVRDHYGISYYSGAYDNGVSGVVKTSGREVTYFGVFSLSSTTYQSKGADGTNTSQTTGRVMIGMPGLNIKYENDYHPEWMDKLAIGFDLNDGGDRYRTAAMQINIGHFKMGFNLFTGDPGLDQDYRDTREGSGIHQGKRVYNGGNSDKYRQGVAYIGFGPLKVGANSEQIRHQIQNRFAHDFLKGGKVHHFQVLERKNEFNWYVGTGYGTGLW